MKKSFFYLAVSAVALSACTSEDLIEDAAQTKIGKVISFETVVNKHSRTDLTATNINKFAVFGYYILPGEGNEGLASRIFYNDSVSRQPDNTWTYDGDIRSWLPGAKYYFFAYSCGDIMKLNSKYGSFQMDMADGLNPQGRVMKIVNYVCDYTHQHDLIYASCTGDNFDGIEGKESGNATVAFQFKHLLSKIRARFTSAFPDEYTVEISNVSFQNIRNIGTYSPTADGSGWQNVIRPEGEHPYVYLLNTDLADVSPLVTRTKDEPAITDYAYVIPYSYMGEDNENVEDKESTFVYINFTVDVKNKDKVVFHKILTGKVNPVWSAGYQYTYNIKLDGKALDLGEIEFTVSGSAIEPWQDGADDIITIKN